MLRREFDAIAESGEPHATLHTRDGMRVVDRQASSLQQSFPCTCRCIDATELERGKHQFLRVKNQVLFNGQ